jgi:hypothetical protein
MTVSEANRLSAKSWIDDHPGYFPCPENAEWINKWLARNKMEFSYENMGKAFDALVESGHFKADLIPIFNEFGRVLGHDLRSNADKYLPWQLDPDANPQPRVRGASSSGLVVPKGFEKKIAGYKPTKREYSEWSSEQLKYFHEMNPTWDARSTNAYRG